MRATDHSGGSGRCPIGSSSRQASRFPRSERRCRCSSSGSRPLRSPNCSRSSAGPRAESEVPELKGGALRGVRRQAACRIRQPEVGRVARVSVAGVAQAREGAGQARPRAAAKLVADRSLFPEDATTGRCRSAPTTLMASSARVEGKRTPAREYLGYARIQRQVDGAPVWGRALGRRSRSRQTTRSTLFPSLARGAADGTTDRAAPAGADRGRDPSSAEERSLELERTGRPGHARLLRRGAKSCSPCTALRRR